MGTRLSIHAALTLALVAGSARGATLALAPSAMVVSAGSLVGVQVYGADFPLGTDGGDFTLHWSANLEYVSLVVADPPWDVSAYDDSSAAIGTIDFVDVFSTSDTPGAGGVPFAVATLTLRAVSEGAASVAIAPSLVGWSLAGESIDVGYGPDAQLAITAAPAPSVATLVALGLGALLLARRRSRMAR